MLVALTISQLQWTTKLHRELPDVPIVLLGLKLDLQEDTDVNSRLLRRTESPVSSTQAQLVANKIGAAEYLEWSALTGERLELQYIARLCERG